MYDSDFQPEIYDWIKKKNNNRFGAVLECCINYLDLRIHENPEDLCTFITFDTSAEYIFESKKVNPNLIEEFGSNLDIGGGTYFYTGFELAFKLIKDENEKFKREKSVIVLLTDGGDCNSTKTKKLLEEQLQNFPEVLIHTVGFGEAGNSQDFLKEIAQMGKGDFHLAKDNIELGKSF
ncbi:zinc finger (c3hc4-type ring finger) family protein [Anaeramoeba ignava]|uniref:Zinc finger (C3hc4-type ring finger) family protein n=1 Tax=Anaeramoeba ignava TaxID=1746090 RepID=A0A9Q0LM80_ANAIG|nr:zinc finger (c3hc4-type ring finger) family protein [Anaeramoeba ignava]